MLFDREAIVVMLKRFILLASFFIIAAVLLIAGCTAESEVNLELASDEGGTVSGEGHYREGEEVTVRAEADEGYTFDAWQKEGEKVSSSEHYTFTVESDQILVAIFDEIVFEITAGEDGEVFEKIFEVPVNIVQASAGGNYLLSKIGIGLSTPVYSIFDIEKWDYEQEEFLDNAEHKLPSLKGHHNIYAPQVSPDGKKIAYTTKELNMEPRISSRAIYIINFGIPVDIIHGINLESDELAMGITPGWEPNSEGIYYITGNGLMYYSFETQEPTEIVPVSELRGLIQKNEDIPAINLHAFNIQDDTLQLAYVDLDENKIITFSLEDKIEKKIIDVETEIKDIMFRERWGNELDYLFNGKYLALRPGLIIETQTGEKVDFGTEKDVLAYAWNREDRLVVLLGEKYGDGYNLEFKLFDNELKEIETLSTFAPEPGYYAIGFEVTSHNDKWLFGIDGEVYSFKFE